MDKRKLKDFAVEEIAKDPLETAVFRSHMQLENARLPIIVILDKSIYGIVRLLVAQSAKKKNNEKELEELMNKFNKQYSNTTSTTKETSSSISASSARKKK